MREDGLCYPCPRGGKCDVGTDYGNIVPDQGFSPALDSNVTFFPCLNKVSSLSVLLLCAEKQLVSDRVFSNIVFVLCPLSRLPVSAHH